MYKQWEPGPAAQFVASSAQWKHKLPCSRTTNNFKMANSVKPRAGRALLRAGPEQTTWVTNCPHPRALEIRNKWQVLSKWKWLLWYGLNFSECFHRKKFFPAGTKPSENRNITEVQESHRMSLGLNFLTQNRGCFRVVVFKLRSESMLWRILGIKDRKARQRRAGGGRWERASHFGYSYLKQSDYVWPPYLRLKKWVLENKWKLLDLLSLQSF